MASTSNVTGESEGAVPSGRLVVISSDCHVGPQRMADYREYVDPYLRQDFDDYVAATDAHDASGMGAREAQDRRGLRHLAGGGAPSRDENEGLWDMTVRNGYLRADGVAGEVMFPQGGAPFAPYPAISSHVPPMIYEVSTELRNAGAHIYNRWLADFCSDDPKRHLGVGILPIRDISASVREVEWIRASNLTGGVNLPALSGNDFPNYNDPIYESLWAACAANEVPLNTHGGARQNYGTGPEVVALILSETDWWSHRALWFMIFSGVFERYPTLHLAITEQRTQWVEPTLADLDSLYLQPRLQELRTVLPRKPSEYFATNCYIGASFMSKQEAEGRHRIGVDRIMWGTDYPHIEGTWPWTDQSLRWSFANLPEEELRQMLGTNAIDCYHLDRNYLEDFAANHGPTLDEVQTPLSEVPTGDGAEFSWAFRTHGTWT